MNSRTLPRCVCAAALATFAPACSDDDSAGGSGYPTATETTSTTSTTDPTPPRRSNDEILKTHPHPNHPRRPPLG